MLADQRDTGTAVAGHENGTICENQPLWVSGSPFDHSYVGPAGLQAFYLLALFCHQACFLRRLVTHRGCLFGVIEDHIRVSTSVGRRAGIWASIKNNNIRKFNNLKQSIQFTIKTPPQWIKNLSNTEIPQQVSNFLALGPKFSIEPKKIRYQNTKISGRPRLPHT
ncbi:hypothetical protein NQ317_019683 [Molorchus minor]|uniref:Uncharacterized protein n=1 Tax=Molorchus minor TaxID=1323400 RepID=A0ABQ9IRD3_9CUCU|nr:hypothetical protein NQ317_019683 [Molorchus minor]